MSRTFTQIETTLPQSQKMRQLNHAEKWAYLCAHFSSLGNYIGLFRYPTVVWADDADTPVDELEHAIKKMTGLELIVYDAEDSYVQINSWFLKRTGQRTPVGWVLTPLTLQD